MTTQASTVIGGVDTHNHTHYAAAVDQHGRLPGHQEFPATDRGYQRLLAWIRGHGQIAAIGVESTGSFGATLTRALTKAGERVVEVNRPNRLARRMDRFRMLRPSPTQPQRRPSRQQCALHPRSGLTNLGASNVFISLCAANCWTGTCRFPRWRRRRRRLTRSSSSTTPSGRTRRWTPTGR